MPPPLNSGSCLRPENAARISLRTWHMVVIAFLTFAAALSYDVPGTIAPFLKRDLSFTGEQLGLLYTVYHAPNVLLVLVGGVIMDAVGPDVTAVGTTSIVLGSSIILASGTSMAGLIAWRVLLGIGYETLNVAQAALLNRAFDSGEVTRPDCVMDFPPIAVVNAFATVVSKVGSLISFETLPALLRKHGWVGVHLVTGAGALSLLFAIILLGMERGWVACCKVSIRSDESVYPQKIPPPVGSGACGEAAPAGRSEASADDHAAEELPLLPAAIAEEDGRTPPLLQQHLRRRPATAAADDDEAELAGTSSVTAAATGNDRLCLLRCGGGSSADDDAIAATGALSRVGKPAAARRRVAAAVGACGCCGFECAPHGVCTPALAVHAALLLLYMTASLPFTEISTALYAGVYGYSDERAAATSGIQTLVCITTILPMSLLLDYKLVSYHAMLLVGAAAAVPAWSLLAAASPVPPEVASVLTGFANAAVTAAAWPALVFRLPRAVQGRVLGATMAAQNALMVGAPLAVGALRDHAATLAGSSAALAGGGGGSGGGAGAGFGPAMWLLASLAMASVFLALWLGALDGWAEPYHRCAHDSVEDESAAASEAAPATPQEGSAKI